MMGDCFFMVADFCHFVFLCLRPETKTVISTLALRHEDTTKGSDTNYFYPRTRKFQRWNSRPFTVDISLFHLAYFVLSCLRPRRNNENQACFRYFAFAFRKKSAKYNVYENAKLSGGILY